LPAPIVVIAMFAPLTIRVTLTLAIPSMVVIEVAPRRRPVAFEVSAAQPVRLDPIRAGERRPRPVPVVPKPSPRLRIPVAFDPFELRSRPRRHAIHPRRWRRRADREAERHLRRGWRGEEQETEQNNARTHLIHTLHSTGCGRASIHCAGEAIPVAN